jgi:hypothetical protein
MSETDVDINADIVPSAETQRLTSAHTIEVFNILQTYRGLPLFEKLVLDSEGVIKLSLAADRNAAPKDDPRFVIWGEVQPEHDADEYQSTTRSSLVDFSLSNPSSVTVVVVVEDRVSRRPTLLAAATALSKRPLLGRLFEYRLMKST